MNTITNRMSGDEAALWTAISTFAFDAADAKLTFAARLARENGWDLAYTQRVIEEYRKFLFLCCVSDTGVTPSDPVDQAWHLHLTYTRSYWIDLCQNTLGRELHHNPTKGGSADAQKFDGMYTDSQTLYERYFGETPPPDIWHPNAQRFADIDFERVNRRTNWVIRKPNEKATSVVALWVVMVVLAYFFSRSAIGWLVLLLVGLFLAVVTLAITQEPTWRRWVTPRSSWDSGSVLMSFDGDSHCDGHGGDCGDGDSGCSASGCSSGCSSGCGGGCGS